MNHLTSFEGRMFKVFDDADFGVWRRWISALKVCVSQPPGGLLDSYDAMRNLVTRLGATALAEPKHVIRSIWGPGESSADGAASVQAPVRDFLRRGLADPEVMMRALVDPKNDLMNCSEAGNKSFFYSMVSNPSDAMGQRYLRVAADASDLLDLRHPNRFWTWTDILERWVDDGCPFEQLPGHTYSLFPDAVPPPADKTTPTPTCPFPLRVPKEPVQQKFKVVKSGRIWVH